MMTLRHNNLVHFFLILTTGILISIPILSGNCEALEEKNPTVFPNRDHATQSVRIVRALEQYHYLEKKMDNTLSSIILDKYLKQLDPGKKLFLQSDIASINQYKFRLDDELKRGNLMPAFEIFNIYLTRTVDRMDFILESIADWETRFDFNKEESLVIDNELREWPPDETVMKSVWKKDLKNHILTMILDGKENAAITDELKKLYEARKKRFLQTNENDVFQIFMNAVTTSFDPHTQFFPPRASEDFDIHMRLSLEGIGAVLQREYEYTKVVRLIPKGPADNSHQLMPGDRIIGVGQGENGEIKDTIGQRLDEVVKLIRGPKNTIVRLKIIPAKKSSTTKTIQIRRDRVKLEDQSAKKEVIRTNRQGKEMTIGVIEIPTFYIDFEAYNRGDKDYKSTTKDVKNLLLELKEEKIDGLIMDLRDNGGGSLREANQLTGLFLKTGPTVQVRGKYQIQRQFDDDPEITYSGPMIVLINRMSASASEIFAGAIKDYQRGVIVGTRSFGKGTVQHLQPLGEGKLKLTSAKFYRVSGKSTQHRGILPDLEFPRLYKIEDTGESSLDGALPWDTIFRTFYNAYRPLEPLIEKLNGYYQERAKSNPELIYLKRRIKMGEAINAETTLSLKIDDRRTRQKTYEKMELDIENDYLTAIGSPKIEAFDPETSKIKETKQIMMEQTHQVMADMIAYSRLFRYSWQ